MLLALDVGNTNMVLGLFRLVAGSRPEMVADWRVTTHKTQTIDEYGVLFVNLFQMRGISLSEVKSIVISSVVPPVDTTLRRVCERYFHVSPTLVDPAVDAGMPILIDNPSELGADRLVNSIGAFERYGGPCVVVDFGTATTFDVISERGEFIGGVIAPGLGISADALFSLAARLARVDICKPAKTIGTNTTLAIQSGLYYGYVGLVDGILERILSELGTKPRVIATGGLAKLIVEESKYISTIDSMLTLDGLKIVYERSVGTAIESKTVPARN
jgi:type III pantothenate kinase